MMDRAEVSRRMRAAPGRGAQLAALVLAAGLFAACTPTVKVEPSDKPITINLNIKLDADVRVRLEEKAEQDVQTNPIF